jgi:hypothetical protein
VITSAVFLVTILGVVSYLSVIERDQFTLDGAPQRARTPLR